MFDVAICDASTESLAIRTDVTDCNGSNTQVAFGVTMSVAGRGSPVVDFRNVSMNEH